MASLSSGSTSIALWFAGGLRAAPASGAALGAGVGGTACAAGAFTAAGSSRPRGWSPPPRFRMTARAARRAASRRSLACPPARRRCSTRCRECCRRHRAYWSFTITKTLSTRLRRDLGRALGRVLGLLAGVLRWSWSSPAAFGRVLRLCCVSCTWRLLPAVSARAAPPPAAAWTRKYFVTNEQ